MLFPIHALIISAALVLATSAFAQSTPPRGETNSSTMSPRSGNSDSGNNGIGTAGSNTSNNGSASSTINPGNSSLAAAPKPAVTPTGGVGSTTANEPAMGGGSQGAGTSK